MDKENALSCGATEKSKAYIESLLLDGKENAISAAELMKIAGANSTRDISKEVERERLNGAVILSCDKGYYKPAPGLKGTVETVEFLNNMRSRGKSIFRIVRTIERKLQIDGQQEL